MKHYLKALNEYEEKNNCFELIRNFTSVKNSNLLAIYSEGKVNLPSFMLLKKLKANYSDLTTIDPELNSLFLNAISYSKLFYLKIITIIKNSYIISNNFEKLFLEQVQPIGQKLIDVLVHIKSRIRIVRLKRKTSLLTDHSKRRSGISLIPNILRNLVTDSFYKANLFLIVNYNITRILYFLLFFGFLLVINFYLLLPNISKSSLVILFDISYILFAIVLISVKFQVRSFNKMDINGKNVIAYKYRLFFNNILNKRMYYVFALENQNSYIQVASKI